jgi:integrase
MPRLTKRFADSIKRTGKEAFYWDDDLPGFGLRQKPSGALTWVIQYRERGHSQTRRMALGRVGVLTPDEARTEAKQKLAQVAKGGDPSTERRQKGLDMTIADLCDLYLEDAPGIVLEHKGRPKKASSLATDRSQIERHIKPLLGRRWVTTVQKEDVEQFQSDVTLGKTAVDSKTATGIKTKRRGRVVVKGGKGAGFRATATLGTVMAHAVRKKIRPDNPVNGVKLNKLRKRTRFFLPTELARLGQVMVKAEQEGANPLMVDAARLLLLSGCRKSEVLKLRWTNDRKDALWVDFEHRMLRLGDSKTDERNVALGAPALQILSDLREQATKTPDPASKAGGQWVFPSNRGGGHLVGLWKFWNALRKEAGLGDVRLHDLRHGFGSMAAAEGQSLFLLGKVLGHAQARTTEKYAHVNVDPTRAVADRTSKKLSTLLKGSKDGGKVVRMPQRNRRAAV